MKKRKPIQLKPLRDWCRCFHCRGVRDVDGEMPSSAEITIPGQRLSAMPEKSTSCR